MKTNRIVCVFVFTGGFWYGNTSRNSVKQSLQMYNDWNNNKDVNYTDKDLDFYIYDVQNKVCWCSNEKHIEHHIASINSSHNTNFDRSNFVIGLPTEADFAKYDNI